MQLVTDQSDASKLINFDGSTQKHNFSDVKSPVANMNDNSYVNAMLDDIDEDMPEPLECIKEENRQKSNVINNRNDNMRTSMRYRHSLANGIEQDEPGLQYNNKILEIDNFNDDSQDSINSPFKQLVEPSRTKKQQKNIEKSLVPDHDNFKLNHPGESSEGEDSEVNIDVIDTAYDQKDKTQNESNDIYSKETAFTGNLKSTQDGNFKAKAKGKILL